MKTVHRPVWALHVLIVGLAVHNLVMSQLYRAGVRGNALSAVAAWKDVLLVGALALVLVSTGRRGLRLEGLTDWLAVAFGAFVVVYALLPQSILGGGATHKGVAVRHTARPAPCLRVLPRLASRAHGRGAPQPLPHGPADGGRRRALRAARRLPRAALLVAAVGGLVQRPARIDVQRPLGPARELRLQPGRRGHLQATHLVVPLAARDRLPPRRCAVLHPAARTALRAGCSRCCSSSRCSSRTRRAALLALVLGLARPGGAAARGVSGRARRARRRTRVRVRQGVSARRAEGALHRVGAASAGGKRAQAAAGRATTRRARTRRRRASILRAFAPGSAPFSTIRGGTASGTPA